MSKNKSELPPSDYVFSERHAQFNLVRAIDPMSNLELFKHAATAAGYTDASSRAKRDCRKFRRALSRKEVILPDYMLAHIDQVMRERPDLQRLSKADRHDGKVIVDFPDAASEKHAQENAVAAGAVAARQAHERALERVA